MLDAGQSCELPVKNIREAINAIADVRFEVLTDTHPCRVLRCLRRKLPSRGDFFLNANARIE
jgi:hypothetical protein